MERTDQTKRAELLELLEELDRLSDLQRTLDPCESGPLEECEQRMEILRQKLAALSEP